MTDRFNLEQRMLQFMSIVEELEAYEGADKEYIQALAKVYAVKADRLWDCFEELVSGGRL